MPIQDLSALLSSPAASWAIAALALLVLVILGRELPRIPRPLLVLMATACLDMFGLFLVVPLLPFYCERLGTGASLFGFTPGKGIITGLILASFTIAQLISAPLWGRFSDRYGRRPTLLVALLASALAYLIFAFADTLWLLLLSRLVQGAGGGTVGVVQAYVADSVQPTERARALGWLSAATNLGVVLGPVLGSCLMLVGETDLWPGDGELRLGTAAPGLAAATLCLLNMAFAARWLRESKPAAPSDSLTPGAAAALQRDDCTTSPLAKLENRSGGPEVNSARNQAIPWRNRDAAAGCENQPQPPGSFETASGAGRNLAAATTRLLLIYGIAIGAGQGINAVMAHLLHERFAIGEQHIGMVYTFIGACAVLSRVLLLGRMVDRFGEARLSRIGTAVLSAGLLLLPFSSGPGSLLLAIAMLPLGQALLFPCVSALLSRVAPAHKRGLYLGLQQTFGGAARIVAPLAYGWAFDQLGQGVPFLMAAALVLLTLPLSLGLGRASPHSS